MAYKNLISPQVRVSIGPYILEDGMAAEYISSAEAHADWCRISLDDELIGYVTISAGDDASMELGYDDDYDMLLKGTVRTGQENDWKEIIVKDDFWKLESCAVKATFLKCTPQDIVRYLLTLAGIKDFKLSDELFNTRGVFVAENKKASEVLKMINAFWDIQVEYFFAGGTFYWGCQPKQEEIYVLEEDNSILDLEPYGTMWCAETIGIPRIHHSEMVEIQHTLYDGYGKVKKIVIRRDEKGFIRQSVYFVPV